MDFIPVLVKLDQWGGRSKSRFPKRIPRSSSHAAGRVGMSDKRAIKSIRNSVSRVRRPFFFSASSPRWTALRERAPPQTMHTAMVHRFRPPTAASAQFDEWPKMRQFLHSFKANRGRMARTIQSAKQKNGVAGKCPQRRPSQRQCASVSKTNNKAPSTNGRPKPILPPPEPVPLLVSDHCSPLGVADVDSTDWQLLPPIFPELQEWLAGPGWEDAVWGTFPSPHIG